MDPMKMALAVVALGLVLLYAVFAPLPTIEPGPLGWQEWRR